MLSARTEKWPACSNREKGVAESAWGIKKGLPEKVKSKLILKDEALTGPFQDLKEHLEYFLLNCKAT